MAEIRPSLNLYQAVELQDEIFIQDWIKQGKNMNMVNREGRTALHAASILQNIKIVNLLLEAGIDRQVKDKYRKTAFDYAITYKNVEIAALIDPEAIKIEEEKASLPLLAGLAGGISNTALVTSSGLALAGLGAAVATAGADGDAVTEEVGNISVDENNSLPIEDTEQGNDLGFPDETPVAEAPPFIPEPATLANLERQANWGLTAIQAANAYQKGLTGAGIVVAQLGGKIDKNHPELNGQIIETFQEGELSEIATQSAGIIVAKKDNMGMHGVAYDVKLLPFDFMEDEAIIDQAFVSQQVKMIHHVETDFSLADFPEVLDRYRHWTDKNLDTRQMIVVGAGDDPSGPSILASLPIIEPNLKFLWMSVVSLGPDLKLQPDHPACGATQLWCLAAPGSKLTTTSLNDSYTDASTHQGNTHLAAAHVAGAGALLMQLYPELPPEKIVEILLESAVDLGKPGVDEVYGYGLLDLEAAIAPLGQMILTGNKHTQMIAAGNLHGEVNGLLAGALEGINFNVSVEDEYERQFQLPAYVTPQSSRLLQQAWDDYELEQQIEKIEIQPGLSLLLSPRLEEIFLPEENAQHLNQFAVTLDSPQFQAQWAYQISEDKIGELVDGEYHRPHPFLSLINDAISQRLIIPLSEKRQLSVASYGNPDSQANQILLSTESSLLQWRLSAGQMSEKEKILGNQLPLWLGRDSRAQSWFYGLQAKIPLANRMELYADFYQGRTQVKLGEGALFSDVSPIQTEQLTLGVAQRSVWLKDDQLDVSITRPLVISQGVAVFSDYQNQSTIISLVPDVRQWDVELGYSGRIEAAHPLLFKTELTYAHHPNHSHATPDEWMWFGGMSVRF